MAVKFSNNASSKLASGISAAATTIVITSGDEGNFPVLGAGDWCPITVVDGSGNREIMKCTARSGVTLTVVRAQEGTTALSFLAGVRVESRLTAASLLAALSDAGLLSLNEVPDGVLPSRLKENAGLLSDANASTIKTGFYSTNGGTTNLPSAAAGHLWHIQIDNNAAYQEWQAASGSQRYKRRKVSGVWDVVWTRAFLDETEAKALTPSGSIMEYAGVQAPSGWLFCFGQAVSRATYAALLAALSAAATGSLTSGSATITAVSTDLTSFGLVGAKIEGTGIPAGATVQAVTATTITLSANATASNSGVALKLFPHGNGDGSTTFNVPDLRGRVVAGRDNMGGASADRLTAQSGGLDGDVLGAAGGAETHTLITAQMPSHTHTATVTDPGHTHDYQRRNTNALRFTGSDIPAGEGSATTTSALTGISVSNSSTGGGGAHNNVQPTVALNKIIKT